MQLSSTTYPRLQPALALPGRSWLDGGGRGTLLAMGALAATNESGDAALVVEEKRLARAAAAGDGGAFATLYERYERRAYNLAYRLTASEDDAADAVQDAFVNVLRRLPKLEDRELAFGSYLFTATRNASYDLMQKRKRAEPSDAIPEAAVPIGAAAGGGFGLDPGDPHEDPDRKLLLESQQEEIRAANERLPERQREALALRELEELSYDEIAEIMEMNRNSVAQLISRARLKLRDELRGGALASIAVSSPECERALPLIAMRDDGQLDVAGDDAAWLDSHLSGCHTCRLGVEAMQEAGTSYRAWAPLAAAPWLFDETMAKAAELTGSDWSETIAERSRKHDPAAIQPGMPSIYRALAAPVENRRRRRRIFAAAGLGAAALLAIVATVLGQDDPPAPEPPAAKTVGTVAEPAPADAAAKKKDARPTKKPRRSPSNSAVAPSEAALPAPQTSAGGTDAGGRDAPKARPQTESRRQRARRPTRRAPTPQTPPPVVTPQPDPVPTPEPPPVVEEPPVVEDPPPPPEPPPTRDPDPPPPTGPPIL
jgi:RNA polymerase sigma-70 factor, ECF subfamily